MYGGMGYGHGARPGRRLAKLLFGWATFAVVIFIHLVIICVPLLGLGGCRHHEEVKEERFKVKLGGSEPSHAPEVGPPEQLRPTDAPPAPASAPTPPEPSFKRPPKKPKPVPKEPTKVVKPKRNPTPKEPTKVVRRKPKPVPVEPKVSPRHGSANTRHKTADNRKNNNRQQTKPKYDGVYDDGGSTFNPNVRIGGRNVGQVKGKLDNRTPQAADSDEQDKKWNDSVGKFVDMLWTPPENVFWGNDPPRAVVELVIADNGRVLRARVVKSSGNPRMDATIHQLLEQLTGRNAPRPPGGGQRTIEVELIPK